MRLLKKIGSIVILPLSEMYECGTKIRKFLKCERDVRNVRNVMAIGRVIRSSDFWSKNWNGHGFCRLDKKTGSFDIINQCT